MPTRIVLCWNGKVSLAKSHIALLRVYLLPILTSFSRTQPVSPVCRCFRSILDRLTAHCLPTRTLHPAFLLSEQTPSRCWEIFFLLLDAIHLNDQFQQPPEDVCVLRSLAGRL